MWNYSNGFRIHFSHSLTTGKFCMLHINFFYLVFLCLGQVSSTCGQGDPISPYLFILCAEILSILVKNNKNITGINIGDCEHKISQYADDTSLLLDGSERSFNESLTTIDYFTSLSGLKINSEKTQIVWIGSKKFSKDVYHHRWKLVWGVTQFQLLGIEFCLQLENMLGINYKKQISKIDNTLVQWSKRALTPIGRITVLKTLVISKLNYLLLTLPDPSTLLFGKIQLIE